MAVLYRDAATPNDAQILHRPRQVADDEAASGFPERFVFRQASNVAQAFGRDAAGMGEISMPLMVSMFLRGIAKDSLLGGFYQPAFLPTLAALRSCRAFRAAFTQSVIFFSKSSNSSRSFFRSANDD
jgi:hypothetical protein